MTRSAAEKGSGVSLDARFPTTRKWTSAPATRRCRMKRSRRCLAERSFFLPLTARSVALAYELPEIAADLKLSREASAGIFLGTITNWNDPRIARTNPRGRFASPCIYCRPAWPNERAMVALMSALSVPKTIKPRVDTIVGLTDAVCRTHLTEECAVLARQLVAALARKRPSPPAPAHANGFERLSHRSCARSSAEVECSHLRHSRFVRVAGSWQNSLRARVGRRFIRTRHWQMTRCWLRLAVNTASRWSRAMATSIGSSRPSVDGAM